MVTNADDFVWHNCTGITRAIFSTHTEQMSITFPITAVTLTH